MMTRSAHGHHLKVAAPLLLLPIFGKMPGVCLSVVVTLLPPNYIPLPPNQCETRDGSLVVTTNNTEVEFQYYDTPHKKFKKMKKTYVSGMVQVRLLRLGGGRGSRGGTIGHFLR